MLGEIVEVVKLIAILNMRKNITLFKFDGFSYLKGYLYSKNMWDQIVIIFDLIIDNLNPCFKSIKLLINILAISCI